MKQIDWVVEAEKKVLEEKRRLKSAPWWKKRSGKSLKIVDFNCDHCKRKIIIQFRHKPGHVDELICLCGRNYKVNAEVTEKWIKGTWSK